VSYEPTASVVVAARNAQETIDACVRSLLELRYPAHRLELVVVDNGSTDGTRVALRGYGSRVLVLEERNRGAAAARNAALAHVESEVVAFTDADCVVDPDWLSHLIAGLADPDVGVMGGTILARRPANEVERFGETIHDHRSAIEVFRPPYAITMNWASPRKVLLEVGGFDERFLRCQDVDLSYRVIQAGYALSFTPEAVVYHRNQDRLSGLFREGFIHGYHSVAALKRHREFVAGFGHRRVDRRGWTRIGRQLVDWAQGKASPGVGYDVVFNSGKKVGKLLGSVRHTHLDL
jgi:GT2 family glycosyltransferase